MRDLGTENTGVQVVSALLKVAFCSFRAAICLLCGL